MENGRIKFPNSLRNGKSCTGSVFLSQNIKAVVFIVIRQYHFRLSGRSAVWLARWTGGPKVAGSSPVAPTNSNFWPFGKNVERLSL